MNKKCFDGIPEKVFLVQPNLPSFNPNLVIMVRAGEFGYYPIRICQTTEEAQEMADRLNGSALDPAIKEACLVGSMFGWLVPGANPATYRN